VNRAVPDTPVSAVERLAQHLFRPVSENVRTSARLHLLDWLGCVAGARRSDVSKAAAKAGVDVVSRAALLGNLLEMDDVHRAAILHPGPVVWPAALTAACGVECDFEDLLCASIRGYEAVIDIGSTLDAYHYGSWHNTSTAGGFGAAAAAGFVYGLNAEQLGWAFGNVGSVAGGLWHMRHHAVMTKQFHVAHAVRTGTWAAQLARHGFTGSAEILDGPQGLYAAMTKAPKLLTLDDGWKMEQVSFKPWAACRHTHPAIDAALELRAQGALKAPIRIETYSDAISLCDQPEPRTTAEAKFSLQHCVAIVAVRGEPRPIDFEPDAIADPDVEAVRAQVTVAETPDISARYPEHFGARLTTSDLTIELVDTRGDPERPLSEDDVLAKARTLICWGGLNAAEADRVAALVLNGNPEPSELVRLLEDWL
jgi:2-methylcitrate dehydratase PrpD